jgi:hypothetical protein
LAHFGQTRAVGKGEKAEDIEKIRSEMEALASQLNGRYDGWELQV